MKTKKRLLGILLSLVMMLGLMPGMSLKAYAEPTEWSADQTINTTTQIDDGITLSNNITLTINNGVTLTVNGGISGNKTLTVEGGGTLIVKGSDGDAGTSNSPDEGGNGGNGGNGINGSIIVQGASVEVTGGNGGNGGHRDYSDSAGGYGGNGGCGVSGNVTVNSGSITVTGGSGGDSAYGDVGNAGQAVSGTITGTTVQESADNSSWSNITSGSQSDKQYIKAVGAAATLTITQITSDMLSGYESTATLTADMFPGFIGATAAEAAAWSEVPRTGSPFLIYGFNESGAQVQVFFRGAPRDNVTISTVGDLISSTNQGEGALVYYVGEPSGNKESAIPATVTANNRTYDGTEKPLVTVNGEPTGGTMQYAVGADTTTEPTEGWSTSIPKATNVGTYYVWYKAKGDGDHIDSALGVVTVTIKEKAAAHTHELKHVDAKEPTCEEDGYEAHYECTVEGCGEWFEDDTKCVPIDKETFIKKATGHKWDKGVVTQEATYDETGIKTYTCTKCNATRVEIIPRKTRSYSDSSDSSSDSDGGGSGSSGNKSGNISTRSIDINGNVIQTQADSGAPVSDRGGNWGNENLSWTYTKSDGNLAKSEWLNLEYNGHTYWYYFDDSSIMQTDWFNYNGATYYFVPEMDGWCGRMATGWQQIGDKWYYFEPTLGASQGQMYRGAMTPDGHVVGADGAWDGNGTAPVGAIHTGTAVIGS